MAMNVVLVMCVMGVVGCAQFTKVNDQDDGRLRELAKRNAVHVQRSEEGKISNILSEIKREHNLKIKVKPKVSYPLPDIVNEDSLFSEVLGAFQTRDASRLDFYADKYIELFPKSVSADNALYLRGQLNLMLGLPSEALRDFERVIREYPQGNKRVSALFGKAVAFRKMQLFKYAEEAYGQVKNEHPGSPEAFKVDLELRLIEAEKGA